MSETVVMVLRVKPFVVRSFAGLLAAFLAFALCLISAPAASAHDELVSTDPAADANLTAMPSAVTLTFSDAPVSLGLEVVVKDQSGNVVTTGDPTLDGVKVSVPVKDGPDATPGEPITYIVSYRVTSADGHPISGRYTFTAASAADQSSSTGPVATPPPSGSGASGVVGSAPGTVTATPAATGQRAATEQSSELVPIVLGLAAIVLLGGIAVLIIRLWTPPSRED